jgi:prolipoprotein diacylglyceryltransferase
MVFGFRFLVEYVKEDQVAFEAGMKLNMGQLLSIPFIIAGIALLFWAFREVPEPVAKKK